MSALVRAAPPSALCSPLRLSSWRSVSIGRMKGSLRLGMKLVPMKIDLDHAYGYTSRALPPATDWADHSCGTVS